MSDGGDPARPFRARGLTDVRSMREVLWPAFEASSGARQPLDYRQDVDMVRLRHEVVTAPPGARPDALIVADPVWFARDGLLVELGPLAAGDRPHAWSDPAGRWRSIYVQPIVAVVNERYVGPIGSWEAFTDAMWQRRIAVEAPERMLTTGPAFAELRDTMGDARWTDWLAGIAGRDILQVADNERAVLEVATGSRWLGLANWNVARRVRPGSPVRHVFLDPTPLVPGFAVAVAAAPHADLAARFVEWLASAEGQDAIAKTGRIPAVGAGGPTGRHGTVVPASIAVVAGRADWVVDPDAWTGRYRRIFPQDAVRHTGKLRD